MNAPPELDRPVRVVAGAVCVDGKVLCARRGPGSRHAGKWELAGGKVEPGESDAAALARELDEELGITVRVGPHLGDSVHTYGRRTVRLVAYACTLQSGTPQTREHDALQWRGPDELAGLDWASADVPLLSAVARWLAHGTVEAP